jgi:hypothetical protein
VRCVHLPGVSNANRAMWALACKVRNLRIPGALIGLGFAGVLASTIANLIADQPATGSTWVYLIATTVGYGLAGFACWRWTTVNWQAPTPGVVVRTPSRWMAAASVVTAAAVAALTYQLYQQHPALVGHNVDLHYGLRLAGDVAGTLGFLLAAAGFWIASNARPAEPNTERAQASVNEGGPYSGRLPESANDVKI